MDESSENELTAIDIQRIEDYLNSTKNTDKITSKNTGNNTGKKTGNNSSKKTSDYNSNKKNEESTDNLNNRGRKPPENQFYRQLEIPDFDIKLTGYFIGENGKNFKRITNMAGVKYIWWDSNIKKIEIWGPESKLNLACNILKDHYKFIENRFKA
jgi:hypothetical protein